MGGCNQIYEDPMAIYGNLWQSTDIRDIRDIRDMDVR